MKGFIAGAFKTIAALIVAMIIGFAIAVAISMAHDSKVEIAQRVESEKLVRNEQAAEAVVFSKAKPEEATADIEVAEEQEETVDVKEAVAASAEESTKETEGAEEIGAVEEVEAVEAVEETEEAEEKPKADTEKAELKRFDLNEKMTYFGMAIGERPHGPGLILDKNAYMNRLLIYGYFENGEMDENRSKAWKANMGENILDNDFEFSLDEGMMVNEKVLGDSPTYLDYHKEKGITNIFSSEVLKISLEPTDCIFQGKLKDNLADGKDKLYYRYGRDLFVLDYKGEFDDGRMDGDGVLYHWNGKPEYDGDFKEGLYHGKGTLYYYDGTIKYEGKWKKGYYDNKGTLYYSNGNIEYEGEWNKGMLSGTTRDGRGKSYYENGQLKYDGDWNKGEYHGKGKLYNEDGSLKYSGKWDDGEPK